MVKSEVSLIEKRDKTWLYDEYYFGDEDDDSRRNGQGENHWTGAESIEWYRGRFTHDTMHGEGDYRWRYLGPEGAFITYEGQFYANCMHGYGAMSYPDGRVFNGLFHSNDRWGPGVERQICLQENVGFWSGKRLIRLTWRPAAPSVAPDFIAGANGKAFVEQYRIMLTRTLKIIGETNSALELLKQCGADPCLAAEKWTKLYPKHCTDLESQLCHVDVFDHDYYKGKINSLEEVTEVPEIKETDGDNPENMEQNLTYFAWNNDEKMIKLMKHCYKHEDQRVKDRTNLEKILNGPRKCFRPSGKHERDSRTLLMASYLGHITNVVQLVNEQNVHPNVSDMQGNTALMYATCGDQDRIIHFLVEAGANVNSYNDSCCTPLGVALMRYTCAQKEIAPSGILQAFLPRAPTGPAPPPVENNVSDWYINRDLPISESGALLPKMYSKTGKIGSAKRIKSLVTLKEGTSVMKKKTEAFKTVVEKDYDSDESFSDVKRLFSTINQEYMIRVNNIYTAPNGTVPQYLFDINNMVLDVAAQEVLWQTTAAAKSDKIGKSPKKSTSRVQPSKEAMWQGYEKEDFASLGSFEKLKLELLSKIMLTILQLLSDGADPKLVRCPQPALFMAVVTGSSKLVGHLMHYGIDVNETYPCALNYSALDVAISQPLTFENVEIIRILLESGAETNHRLQYDEYTTAILGPRNPIPFPPDESSIPGPTLLHAVLARQTDFEFEVEIISQILELLLDHHCSPVTQFNGRSAIDVAMNMKMDLFDIFVQRANAYLNEIINSSNQTILVKMFSAPFFKMTPGLNRFPILTNLLINGADPLLSCQDGEVKYKNLFEFVMKTFTTEIDKSKAGSQSISMNDAKSKLDAKSKVDSAKSKMDAKTKIDSAKSKLNAKSKADSAKSKLDAKSSKLKGDKGKLSSKAAGKSVVDIISDYEEAVELITECARLLHIRWIQGTLTTELIEVINKYRHRNWNMIIKEHKKERAVGLWLTPQRCLEIWDMLKTTKKKKYKDERVLKHLLCIVQFYHKRTNFGHTKIKRPLTATEKNVIDLAMGNLLREFKAASKIDQEAEIWKTVCVKPEFDSNGDKYNVCFECSLPVEYKIQCTSCRLVYFCSSECMRRNIDRAFCHPCSEVLKLKYFPSPLSSEGSIATK